jgi:hypothetical protein
VAALFYKEEEAWIIFVLNVVKENLQPLAKQNANVVVCGI